MKFGDKGWLLQVAQVQRQPSERSTSEKREAGGLGVDEERDKGRNREMGPVG